MGWANGIFLADRTWQLVRKYVPEEHRRETAREIIKLFEDQDADDYEDDLLLVTDAGLRWFLDWEDRSCRRGDPLK